MTEAEWDLVTKYFEATSPADPPCATGRLCEGVGVGLYLSKDLWCIDVLHFDPKDETQNIYSLRKNPPDMFDRQAPIYELHLESKEELIALRAKRRPFVVLSTSATASRSVVPRLGDEGFLGVPLYSFRAGEEEFKQRIRALEYNNLFFLPQELPHLGEDSFCRFDRIQFLHPDHIVPRRAKLTHDAWWMFAQWLRFYITGKTDNDVLEYRSLRLSAVQEAFGEV